MASPGDGKTGRVPTSTILTAVQLLAVVVGAVWAVATIKGTTQTLGTEIRGLSTAVVDLKSTMRTIDDRQYDMAIELGRLQAITGMVPKKPENSP